LQAPSEYLMILILHFYSFQPARPLKDKAMLSATNYSVKSLFNIFNLNLARWR